MKKIKRDGSLAAMALDLGLDEGFFYSLKCSSPEKNRYMSSLGENMYDGYCKYINEMSEVKRKSVSNHYWLSNRSKVSEFSRFLKEEGIYGNDMSFTSTVNGILYNSIIGFSGHPTFVKYKKILSLFEKFKEVNKGESW